MDSTVFGLFSNIIFMRTVAIVYWEIVILTNYHNSYPLGHCLGLLPADNQDRLQNHVTPL